MLPPSNTNNPFDYSSFKRPSFSSDQNPSSTLLQDHDPPFLFTNFPSPFFDEHESPLNQILLQNQAHQITYHNKTEDPTKNNSKNFNLESSSKSGAKGTRQLMSSAPLRRRNLGVVPRRRTGKKDRHSKICTAHGIRDRRMRLSLQVARKFFDLQDILGYDKASKTIEWLFTQSKKAINELKHNNVSHTSDAKSESFVSECEVVSGNEEMSTIIAPAEDEKNILPFSSGGNDGEKLKSNREAARDKARARARCRTREKVMMKTLQLSGHWCKSNPSADDKLDQKLGFPNSPFEGVDNQEIRVCPTDGNVYEQQLADVGTIEKLLGDSICPTTSATAALTGLNLDPNSNLIGFHGNWESLLAGNPNYTIYSATSKFQGFHQ